MSNKVEFNLFMEVPDKISKILAILVLDTIIEMDNWDIEELKSILYLYGFYEIHKEVLELVSNFYNACEIFSIDISKLEVDGIYDGMVKFSIRNE